MISPSDLTDEQRRIAAHEEGPALVFAVAGAGKTTSMVHRIRYLVEGRGVDPERILASSFSRATVGDIDDALDDLGVTGVDVRTLHSLGYQLLRQAENAGHLPERTRHQDEDPATLATILAGRALTRLAMERDLDTHELDVDRDELADRIAAWKQDLAYPDLDRADLPASARDVASEAEADRDDLLTLYRYAEDLRRQENWLTYDDMLVEGWEVLHRFPDIRSRAQSAYDHVLVDEFQDVSRVQERMLDVITEPHRNYMAVGDDDQCIYEWRGADPSFILSFTERYDADEYLITDTFRSPAPQLALANAVIAENDERREKQLHLTRGFDGHASITGLDGAQAEAAFLVDEIESLRADGRSLDDMSVLVRTYAQTPFLESLLIDRDLPYEIVGSVPFYRRREVQTLLQYAYWAVLERRIEREGWFDSRQAAARYLDRFRQVLKRPNRYIKHDLIDTVCTTALQREASALDVLSAHLGRMHDRTADRVQQFLSVADDLIDDLDEPADAVLEWLVDAIDYAGYLRRRSAIAEVGEARVRTARSLIAFADGHDSVSSLLHEIVRISRTRKRADADAPRLDIRSIHRAKGLEWPFVFVPGCNEGTLPQEKTRIERSGPPAPVSSFDAFVERESAREVEELDVDVEEERRLLYVAVTRSREGLFLTYDENEPRSSFLDQAEADTALAAVDRVDQGLTADPDALTRDDLTALCRGIERIGLERYLRTRWSPPDSRRTGLARRLQALRQTRAAAAENEEADPNDAEDASESDAEQARSAVRSLQEAVGERGLPVQNEDTDVFFPDDATFTFTETDGEIAAYWQGDRIGTIDPLGPAGPPPSLLLDAPWEAVTARFERMGSGRRTLYVSIDTAATRDDLPSAPASENGTNRAGDSNASPSVDPAVDAGAALLLEVLRGETASASPADAAAATG